MKLLATVAEVKQPLRSGETLLVLAGAVYRGTAAEIAKFLEDRRNGRRRG